MSDLHFIRTDGRNEDFIETAGFWISTWTDA